MAVRNLQFVLSGKDNVSGTFDKVGKKADGLGSKLGALGKAGAIGLGAAAGAGIASFGVSSVKAFTEAEESQKRLQFALDKFPKTAGTSVEALGKINTELARKTKFDDDAIASGQAVLAQFNLTGKQLEQVTPLLADYASSTGKEMPDAAQDLGKALLGNAKALKSIGISYKSTGDSTKDFANITALMQAKVGGFAATEGKTAAGTAAILKNQFGELQEMVGSKLVPILQSLAGKVLGVVQGFQSGEGSGGKLRETFEKVKKTFEDNRPQLEKLARAIGEIAKVIITKVLPIAVRFQVEVISKMISGIGLLVDAFNGIKGVVQTVVAAVVPPFLDFFGMLVNGAASAFGWVPGIGGKLKTAAREFETFKTAANISLQGIQDKEITVSIKKSEAKRDDAWAARGTVPSMRPSGSAAARKPQPVVVHNRTTLDGRVIADSTRNILGGRVARGYVSVSGY